MTKTRRSFLTETAGAAFAAALSPELAAASGEAGPLVVATWPFARPGSDKAMELLLAGRSGLDAVEEGICVVESGSGSGSVGLGGIPNAAGVVQLDACIMTGPGHRAGSVAALEGFAHPISIARRVMEKTRHVMLAGEGARLFALQEGFESLVNDGHEKHQAWLKKQEKAKTAAPGETHDTIAMLVLAPDGTIHGGCSTSGWAHKLPGRVGDSPIIGGGLYVDNEVGAAGATGLGEHIMRYCGSFLVVEFMRQGLAPTDACLKALERMAASEPDHKVEASFVALDKHGRFGAAGSAQGFNYCVTTAAEKTRVLTAPSATTARIGPEGGNRR